tara:strand:+ start:3158 stop:3289 length:132 start_codon:yes stop_codon:yes gene_type:complete
MPYLPDGKAQRLFYNLVKQEQHEAKSRNTKQETVSHPSKNVKS